MSFARVAQLVEQRYRKPQVVGSIPTSGSKMKILPGVYLHYKGHEYRVLGVAKHSETFEDMVVYEALYKNEKSLLWVRPLTMFTETVVVDGVNTPRFTYLRA